MDPRSSAQLQPQLQDSMCRKKDHPMLSLKMYSVRDFLGVLVGAAVAVAACLLLLLPPPPSPPCAVALAGQHPALPSAASDGVRAAVGTNNLDMLAVESFPREDKLLELLGRAAMEDKTIIMTFTNEAFSAPGSLMDLFLESFRTGVKTEPLLEHLVIVAVDAKAFTLCKRAHPLCYHLSVDGATDFSSEQEFNARDYLDMMWLRHRFQARILELGYSFVFTDVDIIWFRNPLLRVPVAADIAMSCDQFYGDNPYDLNKRANGGFVYARSRPRTVAFYRDWYREARAAYPGRNEQFVFDALKHELAARHGVPVQFVDTAYLSGFCHAATDFHKMCTFHGNCIPGLHRKLVHLRKVLDDWKQFRANNTALTD